MESDLFKSNSTVLSSTAFASFKAVKSRLAPLSLAALKVNATSSAVSGVPSVKLTSSLIFTVYFLKSLEIS